MKPFYERDGITIYCDDCLRALRQIPDNSIDTCITDPPYGLSKEPDVAEVLRRWLAGDAIIEIRYIDTTEGSDRATYRYFPTGG